MHIARKAEVPIVFGRLDYQKKNLTFSEAVLPSLLDDEIMYLAQVFYRDAKGLHPDNFGPVRLKNKGLDLAVTCVLVRKLLYFEGRKI
ncbi:MAG: hypothetical protein CM15mP58_17090 [Burkholderiaceae bacterium]|nr:MAG: hypothetical protein CM15mP58_17090 [Burkholderiaceae bacterium]